MMPSTSRNGARVGNAADPQRSLSPRPVSLLRTYMKMEDHEKSSQMSVGPKLTWLKSLQD
jgi:hypothetical protein